MKKRTFAVARRERAGAALDTGRGPKVPRGRKSSDKPAPAARRRGRKKRKQGKR